MSRCTGRHIRDRHISDNHAHGVCTDKPDMIQQLLSEDADLDNSLVLLRDFIRDLFAPSDVDEPTPEEETIEEAIEDPDELLDAS